MQTAGALVDILKQTDPVIAVLGNPPKAYPPNAKGSADDTTRRTDPSPEGEAAYERRRSRQTRTTERTKKRNVFDEDNVTASLVGSFDEMTCLYEQEEGRHELHHRQNDQRRDLRQGG